MMIERLEQELHPLRAKLKQHPVYKSICSVKDIQFFMENHVFAVWDFMSLLKQLQNLLSCNKIPWRPSGYPKASRLINEIVWGEESDLDRNGVPMSHFEMYLQAMRSLGASSKKIDELIVDVNAGESMKNILSKIFGSICLNLSKTPEIPKSVEHDEKTAPNDDVASIVIIVSGQFGI